MKKWLLFGLTALALAPEQGLAGPIGPGAFSANAQVVTYDNLTLGGLNLGGGLTLVGDPLTISGDTYATYLDSHLIYQNPEYVFGLGGGALLTDHGNEHLQITLGTPVEMAGIYLTAGSSWSATVDFSDASNNLLGVEFLSGSGSEVVFAGWQSSAGLIARLDIFDTSPTVQNMFFKDLTTESPSAGGPGTSVPEPSGLTLLGVGLVLAAVWHHRRSGPYRKGQLAAVAVGGGAHLRGAT